MNLPSSAARVRTMRLAPHLRPVAAWLALGAALITGYFLLPSHDLQDFAYQLPGMIAVLAVLLGIRLHRPPDARPWLLLALGLALTNAGDWTWVILDRVFAAEVFPSVADLFYLAGIGLVGVAVAWLMRGRIPGGDRAGLLDALIVAAGVGLVSWTFLMAPIVADPMASAPEIVIGLAYPLLDILVLAVVVRLYLVPGAKSPTLWFVVAALLALLLSDFPYAVMALSDGYATGDLVELGWLAAPVLWGAAALHPSMAEVAVRVERGDAALSRWRIVLLAGASLMAPLMLLLQWTIDQPLHVPVIALGCVVLFLLVIARLGGVVGDLRATLVQRRELEQELERRALHDPLTGLANRVLFADRLEQALRRRSDQTAVLFLDLDDFKNVNDTNGHHAGDLLLSAVADALRASVRAADTVARLGGDEFAVLLVEHVDSTTASECAERLLAAIRGVGAIAGWDRPIGASIGISVGAGGVASAATVMREADIAMYVAKSKGKGTHTLFDPNAHDTEVRSAGVRSRLEQALAANEFELHYQPIVDLGSGDLAGVEALVRWRHPTRGLLMPAQFIPAAEASGAIVHIGRWILREAVRQAVAWRGTARAPGILGDSRFVSVNLSSVQLMEGGLPAIVSEALAGGGIAPRQLVLELTETGKADAEAIAAALGRLEMLGVRLAVDDFGTAYASPTRLLGNAFDIIKIDREVVSSMLHDTRAERLFGGMLDLARRFDALVVAEGIETAEQLSLLRQMGCQLGQGYYFAPALLPDELVARFGSPVASAMADAGAARRRRVVARNPLAT